MSKSTPSIAAYKAHATIRKNKRIDASRRTAKWAVTMTKVRLARLLRKPGVKARRWSIATFLGPNGQESAGVVDLVAIRKDHRLSEGGFSRGDLFQMVLIQVKGGSSPMPTDEDIRRLRLVARRYRAAVVLSAWEKGKLPVFSVLTRSHLVPWCPLHDLAAVFR